MRYSQDPPHTEGDGYGAVVEAISRLRDDINNRHVENSSTLEVLEKEVKVAIERIDNLAKGFPGDDPDGHRRAHEALIQRAEERAALYRALREELVKKGLWALIVAIGALVWIGISAKVHWGK